MFKHKSDAGNSKNGHSTANEGQEKKYDANDKTEIQYGEAGDSASSAIDDLEYVDQLHVEDRLFNPVNRAWQNLQKKTFNLKIKQFLYFKCEKKMLGRPSLIKAIIGDGNCFYRSLSYWITGTEDQHLPIRILITQEVKTNEEIKKYLGGTNELNNYLRNNIENDGVWGTDVEIFAAAFLLKTSIYVYSTLQKKWQIFNKHSVLNKDTEPDEKCIYLRNIDNLHYDVVMDVD